MKSRSLTAQILRIFIRINLTVLVIVGIVALIGWVAGWQTQDAFQSAIQVAGLLAIGIGLIGLKSARDKTRNVEVQDSMSATSQDSWRKNSAKPVRFFPQLFVSAGDVFLRRNLPADRMVDVAGID